MKQQVYFHDLDSIDYKECWDLQERLLTSIVDDKMLNRDKEAADQITSRHYLGWKMIASSLHENFKIYT